MSNFSRRDLMKAMMAAGGAYVGSRLGGPLIRDAHAAGEPATLVCIGFEKGYNAGFAGAGNIFAGTRLMTGTPKVVGEIATDAETFGRFPDKAFQKWAAVGVHHNQSAHGGAQKALLEADGKSALTTLAAAMGGSAAIKCCYFSGTGLTGKIHTQQKAVNGVSMQHVPSMGDLTRALGTAPVGNDQEVTSTADRARVGAGLTGAAALSKASIARNPKADWSSAYSVGNAASREKPKPVSPQELLTAYGISGDPAFNSMAGQLMASEMMIRSNAPNVIYINEKGDSDRQNWDFGNANLQRELLGKKVSSTLSRNDAIRTFLDRMIDFSGRRVVVVMFGEFLLTPKSYHDHGDGVVATVLGGRVKSGLSFPADKNGAFSGNTPNTTGFWSYVAEALGVAQNPFGANPHAKLIA